MIIDMLKPDELTVALLLDEISDALGAVDPAFD